MIPVDNNQITTTPGLNIPCVSTRDFEELYEAVKVELQIIKNLIASKRVVNLDEAIAYYESLLKKHEHHVC